MKLIVIECCTKINHFVFEHFEFASERFESKTRNEKCLNAHRVLYILYQIFAMISAGCEIE